MSSDKKHRSHLPMPNTTRSAFVAYDAKDPDHKNDSDRATAPAQGRTQRARRPDRRLRLRRAQRVRRPLQHARGRETGGGRAEVQPLPHHGDLLGDAAGAADRPQSPLGRHGRHHRDRHRRAGLLVGAAQFHVAAGQDAQAQRLQHGAVRQVPRSAGVGVEPGRAVQPVAHRWRRLRVLLRLHRRRGAPVVSLAVRRHHADRGAEDA